MNRRELVKQITELQRPLKKALLEKWRNERMGTASAHNAPLMGEIDIVEITKEKLASFGINPEKNFVPGAFIAIQRNLDHARHPHLWMAQNYKRVIDSETGWSCYPWELTPQYRNIKHIGRGNCSQEAI